jgi:hypothetical protein
MVLPDLESLTDELFETTNAVLGSPAIYTVAGELPIAIRVDIFDLEMQRDYGGSAAVGSELNIEIMAADIPLRPTNEDLIEIPKTGIIYSPVKVVLDDSGRLWRVTAKPRMKL